MDKLNCGPRRLRCDAGMSALERVLAVGWDVDPATGCWEWRGERGSFGRARIYIGNGKRLYPYRVTYEATHGPIPEGLVACHTCDNPGCINPDHIVPGTQQQNIGMVTHRKNQTIDHGQADRIRHIYGARLLTQTQLARAFMVDQKTISRIVREAAA